MNWHLLKTTKIFESLETRQAGLFDAEVAKRLHETGPNELKAKKRKPAWLLLLEQFKEVMTLILIAAAIISGFVGDLKDTIVILIIVVLNAIVGFVQEFRAEKAIEALRKMTTSMVRVRRNGVLNTIPSAGLVPGDLVLLDAGDMVPADLRLIEAHALAIEEASLTGESVPAGKSTHALTDADTAVADRVNMAFKSTLVSHGRGLGVVVATGMQTEIGSIAQMLQAEPTVTPLQKRLAVFGKQISLISILICVGLFLEGWLRGAEPVQMLLTALSVAVAAIPEALPAVVTIALALGARKMVTKHALIRKLPAVETLGSVTYICTDKTGTLTQNKMTVREIWTANPPVAADLKLDPTQLMLLCMIANQDTALDGKGKVTGEPTEIALAAYAAGHDRFETMWHRDFPRVQEIPFDSERKMMTTVHAAGEKFLVVTKGAVEYVRDVCLDVDETVVHQAESYAKQGQRVLVYACKLLDTDPKDTPKESLENDLFCIGMAGLIDPPRPEAAKAVAECRTAGIVPVMITGDHPSTARAIATEIGIIQNAKDRVLNGRELHGMSQDDFEKVVEQIKVYARVTPAQKLRIVKTLQQNGQYVAMTGDGVNDAPALQQADIGVAMGIGGTDVTKEAAHMILLDDNFATIVKAIKEGRRIYDNIRKFIKYIVTSNSGEIWTITIAPLLGMPIPLLPIHILWINLVTDGLPSLALANEPAEPDIMSRPPRPPGESIFANGLGWHTFVFGMLMGAVCLGLQFWAESNHNPHAQTMVFTVLCLSQMGNVMAIRSERYPLYQLGLFTNLPLLGSVLLTFVLQLILIYVPFCHQVFNTQSLTWQEVLLCLGLSSIVFHGVELNKLIRRGKPFELKITKKTAPVL